MKRPDGKILAVFVLLAVATSALFAFVDFHDIGQLWSPIDDSFIYAQYAHEMALGHPYQYYPHEEISTGVTSPLYPWLLAPAFWVGLGGERIVWWWLGLGLIWRVAVAWLVYGLVRRWTRDRRPAFFSALLVALQGNFNWGVSSGMEVGMMAFLLLLSLRAGVRWLDRIDEAGTSAERRRRWAFIVALGILGFARPEGTATVFTSIALIGWWLRRRGGVVLRAWACLLVAVLPWAIWMLYVRAGTGSFATSGMKVKTVMGIPGFDWPTTVASWFNGVRAIFSTDWLGTTRMPLWGWVAGAMGCAALAWRTGRGWSAPSERLPLIWLVGLLIPAFSLVPFVHSSRYEAGHIPLVVALGVVGVWWLGVHIPRARSIVWGGFGSLVLLMFVCGLFTTAERFAMQTEDMFYMHRPIAKWITENTKKDDRIGLSDVGIIPYLTGRPTIDLVGLTTTKMMAVLVSGPGSVWHALEHLKPEMRPVYSVLFPKWFDATDLGPLVADFRLDRVTVAVEAEMQIVHWTPPLYWAEKRVPPEAHSLTPAPPLSESEMRESSTVGVGLPAGAPRNRAATTGRKNERENEREEEEATSTSMAVSRPARAPKSHDQPTTPPWHLVDYLDMADLQSERDHDYRYYDEAKWTMKHLSPLVVAQASPDNVWRVADGGRSWTSHSQFRIHHVRPDRSLRLSIRTYSDYPHRLRILVEGREAGILKVPKNGRSGIFDILNFDIPAKDLRGATDPRVRVQLIRDGRPDDFPYYTSFFLWALQPADSVDAPERSAFEQKLEDRIAIEESHWMRAFRKKHGETFPIDSTDQVLFQTGWEAPDTDVDGRAFRWGTGPNSFMIVPAPPAVARAAKEKKEEKKEEKESEEVGETNESGETGEEGRSRTAGPSSTAENDQATSVPSAYVLEVELEPYVPPKRRKLFWNWIAAEVDGHELIRWDIEPADKTYRCVVPSNILFSGVNGIRFVYGRTYVPAEFEPGNTDQHPLGAKFFSISLRPAKKGEVDGVAPEADSVGGRARLGAKDAEKRQELKTP